MPRKTLQINLHPTLPFRSSNLALPPSPFTPRLPLTPPATPPRPSLTRSPRLTSNGVSKRPNHLPTPPTAPLKWVWQCHICHRQYKLGVTRRCLDDGHYFCAGTTTIKRRDGSRRVKKHKACGSEFDYRGWKEWNTWRRKGMNGNTSATTTTTTTTTTSAFDSDTDSDGDVFMGEADDEEEEEEGDGDDATLTQSAVSPLFGSLAQQQQKSSWFRPGKAAATPIPEPLKIDRHGEKNCWNNCDYPSECRWGKAYGVPTPATATFPPTGDADSLVRMAASPAAQVGDILITLEQQAVVADTIDGVAESTSTSTSSSTSTTTTTSKTAFTDLASLVQSAKRRKSRSEIQGPSPLSSDSASASASASASHSPLSSSSSSSSPVISRFTEDVSDFSVPAAATSFEEMRLADNHNDEQGKTDRDAVEHGKAGNNSLARRAFDEFEFDFRRGFERASGLFGGFVGRGRGSGSSSNSGGGNVKREKEKGEERK